MCDESIGNEEGIKQRAYLDRILQSEQERPVKKFSGVKKNSSSGYSHKKFVIIFKRLSYVYNFFKNTLNRLEKRNCEILKSYIQYDKV